MDIRLLKYFLTVAREGNITKAAERLHVTQPTLSRQLMDLENEIGTELFVRGKRQVSLTASGLMFQQRATEIIMLLEKAQRDIEGHNDAVSGVVSIGCVETAASRMLPEVLETFCARYPMVQYEIYSANGDDIRNKMDNGHVDLGILIEPVETAKYETFSLPFWDVWGLLMRKEDHLATRKTISIEEAAELPLFITRRLIVSDEIESWLGEKAGSLKIRAYHNLITNTMLLIEHGLGYAICVEGAYTIRPNDSIRFVPFFPERKSGHVLAWKKNRIFNNATSLFLDYVKTVYRM